jgi:plasmid stabilization system protein ParE
MKIVFSPRAQKRLEEIAEYLYREGLDKSFVVNYLTKFEKWLDLVLKGFLESGQLMPKFGKDIRKAVDQKYNFKTIHKVLRRLEQNN